MVASTPGSPKKLFISMKREKERRRGRGGTQAIQSEKKGPPGCLSER